MIPVLRILLESSLRISVAAAVVGAALFASRVRSNSLRHHAWLAVLCAMLLMPILPRVAPRVAVPVSIGPDSVPEAANMVAAPIPEAPMVPQPATPERTAAPQQEPPAPNQNRAPLWPPIAFAAYAAGAAFFLSRLTAGWISARAVLRGSRAVRIGNTTAYESPHVSTAVTMGLRHPRIVLPLEWSDWPEHTLCAVLAHEQAHVRRRDTLTSFLAYVNRCLFWFHPLAWWLQRQLAIAAEQDCDDAALAAIGERRKYAEVLLDMAEAVRRRGSRLACQGVGVDGTGLLGRRIDRILRGAPANPASRVRKALVALSCAVAIFVAAACRSDSIYTGELRPDPKNTEILAKQKAAADFTKSAREMDAAQVAALEASLSRNPDNLDARKRLMIFYQASGRKVLGDEKTLNGFWAQKLWLIEHHPEDNYASFAEPLSNAAVYQKARQLWQSVVNRPDAPPAALMNAAAFLRSSDPQVAEKALLRVPESDPRRTFLLGTLYASVLVSPTPIAFATDVRNKVEISRDARLLTATGAALTVSSMHLVNTAQASAEAQAYLERALQLDPNSKEARDELARLRQMQASSSLYQKIANAVGPEASEAQYRKAASLPAAERFQFEPTLGEQAYYSGDNQDYYHHDSAAAKERWELARRYAKDTLRLAPDFTRDPNYGDCVYKADMTLGMIAMRVDGDKAAARKYLLAASKAGGTGRGNTSFTLKLPVLLLKYGGPEERRAVIEYLERYGQTLQRPDLDLLGAAKQLRQGIMPIWYQSQSAQLK